jgi:hypothetical protein
MTKKQKVKEVATLVRAYNDVLAQFNRLNDAIGADDSPFHDVIFKVLDRYVDSVAKLIGDTNHKWLVWYIFENNCGKAGEAIRVNGKRYEIKTPKDFITFLETTKDVINFELTN